jgi:hypothetical protein
MKIKQLLEGLDSQQRSVPELPAMFRPAKISVLKNKTDPRHPMTGYAVGASESADVAKKRLGPDRNDPWEQGWRATPGYDFNPYEPGTPEYAQWEDGQAERQAQPGHYDESVAEGRAGVDDTDTVGFSVNSEKAYTAVMDRYGDYIDHDETSGIMYIPAKMWPNVEMVAFDADGEGATQDDGYEHPDSPEYEVSEASEQYYAIVHKVTKKTLSTHRDIESAKDEWRGLDRDQRPFYAVMATKKKPEDWSISEAERNEMDTPEFQKALASVKKQAAQGPMKTVYDPKTRKYRVVPVSGQKSVSEALGIESDKNYRLAGDYKNYPLYVRKTPYVNNSTNEKFYIGQTQIGREEFKVKGANIEQALQNIRDKIDNILNVSAKVSSGATLDFNVKFATDILGDPREKFFAKVVNAGGEPKLIIAGPEMLTFGKELMQLGFKPSALRIDPETDSAVALPSISYTKNQIANTGLIANGRYEIADMHTDKEGNKIFNLKYHSTAHTKSDKMRLSKPALTVGSSRDAVKESADNITKEDIISKLKDRLGDYLSDISKEIKKDPDLVDKLSARAPGDQMGPPVKTVTTDDGHEIQIHGNEDDGFRVSIKNRSTDTKFKNLDEAVMACEMYCARRRAQTESADYIDEAGKDACYNKVKSRYKIWPSAYASGALVRCRKVGAANWGNKSKK